MVCLIIIPHTLLFKLLKTIIEELCFFLFLSNHKIKVQKWECLKLRDNYICYAGCIDIEVPWKITSNTVLNILNIFELDRSKTI